MKKIFTFFLAVLLLSSLCGCGKSAHPTPYPDSNYPHTYPYNN
jgi:predicted small lipoprotein YifL